MRKRKGEDISNKEIRTRPNFVFQLSLIRLSRTVNNKQNKMKKTERNHFPQGNTRPVFFRSRKRHGMRKSRR